MLLMVRYLFRFWGAVGRERRDLVLENIALRHQLEVLTRTKRRPSLRPADRVLWSWLARVWPGWRQHLVIVRPDTVVRWHRSAWRRYWTWKSRLRRPGRPRIDSEIAAAIRLMTTENPRWGHMRVLGELRKLGLHVSLQTVRRYRRDVPRDPLGSWTTFLRNYRPEIWAADFFTVHTLWFQTLYVFFFVSHDRRTMVHLTSLRTRMRSGSGVSSSRRLPGEQALVTCFATVIAATAPTSSLAPDASVSRPS